eukprot:jgi/Tetstr1/453572/TSEL_040540.t1
MFTPCTPTRVSSLEWKRRWERDVEWISALMHAADAADICDYSKADSQPGKKDKLQDKLQFRPDSGTAVLPEGRVLVKRVKQIVRAWSAGDARKSKDGLNCSM